MYITEIFLIFKRVLDKKGEHEKPIYPFFNPF
jgi:hypothetical protein